MMTPRDRLVVALDVDSHAAATGLVASLSPHAGWFKIGSVLFTREGPRVCALVKDSGARLFLDLKYHDIPNTGAGAVRNALGDAKLVPVTGMAFAGPSGPSTQNGSWLEPPKASASGLTMPGDRPGPIEL